MIKLTISSNIENLHDFIDERLLLLMGEKKVRCCNYVFINIKFL